MSWNNLIPQLAKGSYGLCCGLRLSSWSSTFHLLLRIIGPKFYLFWSGFNKAQLGFVLRTSTATSDSLVTPLSPCVSLCQERNIYFPHLSLSRFSSPLITVSLPAVLFSLFALLCRIFPLLSFSTFADTWALGSNQHLSGLQPGTDCTSNLQSPSMFIFRTDCTSTWINENTFTWVCPVSRAQLCNVHCKALSQCHWPAMWVARPNIKTHPHVSVSDWNTFFQFSFQSDLIGQKLWLGPMWMRHNNNEDGDLLGELADRILVLKFPPVCFSMKLPTFLQHLDSTTTRRGGNLSVWGLRVATWLMLIDNQSIKQQLFADFNLSNEDAQNYFLKGFCLLGQN